MTEVKVEQRHTLEAHRIFAQADYESAIKAIAQALATAEASAQGEAGRWIACEEQVPGGQACLGYDRFYNRVGECEGNGARLVFVDGQKDDCDITHWMPLPSAPLLAPPPKGSK